MTFHCTSQEPVGQQYGEVLRVLKKPASKDEACTCTFMKYYHQHRFNSQKANCCLSNHFQLDCRKMGGKKQGKGKKKKKKQSTVEHSTNRKNTLHVQLSCYHNVLGFFLHSYPLNGYFCSKHISEKELLTPPIFLFNGIRMETLKAC